MKALLALFGLFLMFGSLSFAEETDYTHYCYRVCCLSLDAVYSEGPPQQCVGPKATPDQVQDCIDHCLYDLGEYYEDNPNPTYVTVDQTDMGVIYDPSTGTVEEETAEETNNYVPPVETNEETGTTPIEETGGGAASTGSVPLPEKTGGLCSLGFVLLLPLFFSFRK